MLAFFLFGSSFTRNEEIHSKAIHGAFGTCVCVRAFGSFPSSISSGTADPNKFSYTPSSKDNENKFRCEWNRAQYFKIVPEWYLGHRFYFFHICFVRIWQYISFSLFSFAIQMTNHWISFFFCFFFLSATLFKFYMSDHLLSRQLAEKKIVFKKCACKLLNAKWKNTDVQCRCRF